MVEFLQKVWEFFQIYILPALPFVALVLIEIHLMYNRRENEVMFGTNAFDEKIKAFEFTPEEVETLDDLVRTSKFENKDAVLNSSGLFEAAVNEFYRVNGVLNSNKENDLKTLDSIALLRQKLNFTGSNPLAMVCSSRQFNVGDRVDLELGNGLLLKRSEIIGRSEKNWSIKIDDSVSIPKSLVGTHALIRWTRTNDAVYSMRLPVLAVTPHKILFHHCDKLEKEQLRKWVRQVVDFPVTATFPNGEVRSGVLYDLSAGGILLGLAEDCKPDQQFTISFELPTFGEQNVEVKVLNNLGRRNPDFPLYNSISAVFTGSYAWTQERVLQYIFEATRKVKGRENPQNGV